MILQSCDVYVILHTMGVQLFTDNLYGLISTVFLLGVRHGFDADHLAAIDGMTRFNLGHRNGLGRNAGALFSLGHGVIVVMTALLVALVAHNWVVPAWIESTGAWSSIAVLLVLGIANLVAALRTPAGETVSSVGWRGAWLARCFSASSAFTIAAVGALFAISFDTLSLAALFGMTAMRFGSWPVALLLSMMFVLGMLVTDGLNGAWVAKLVRRSKRAAQAASRMMAMTIGGVSLVVASVGIASQVLPASHPILATSGIWVSAAILLVLTTSFVIGRRLATHPVVLHGYAHAEEC